MFAHTNELFKRRPFFSRFPIANGELDEMCRRVIFAAKIVYLRRFYIFGRSIVMWKKKLYSCTFFLGLRGAISYALSLHLEFSDETRHVIITTTLIIVLITTLLFGGSTMPIMKVGKYFINASIEVV